jgi:epoxyqueuosine reductase
MISHQYITELATSCGFSAVGCAPAEAVAEWRKEQWRDYLASGRHAEMHYLEQHLEKRLNPALLVEGAKSVVCVALNYFTEAEFPADGYTLSRYARGKDYHDVVKERLQKILDFITDFTGKAYVGRAFCDTAPLLERYWAVKAGLGTIGRNRQLIIPGMGSYFFLGVLAVTAEINDTKKERSGSDICLDCDRCLKACPTGALTVDGIDCRRCLSYLTIEHRGDIPDDIAHKMGHRIYGCDACQQVCPHNKNAHSTEESAFNMPPEVAAMTPTDWHSLTEERYKSLFKDSAIERAGYQGLRRNITAVNGE